jgi:hypothetical protein
LYVASGFQQQGVTDILKRDRISPCVPQHLRSAFPATFKQLLLSVLWSCSSTLCGRQRSMTTSDAAVASCSGRCLRVVLG